MYVSPADGYGKVDSLKKCEFNDRVFLGVEVTPQEHTDTTTRVIHARLVVELVASRSHLSDSQMQTSSTKVLAVPMDLVGV